MTMRLLFLLRLEQLAGGIAGCRCGGAAAAVIFVGIVDIAAIVVATAGGSLDFAEDGSVLASSNSHALCG